MQIDWWTLAIQTINFLIVAWLLNRLLYRPIRRVIEQREAADRAAAEAAEKKAQAADAARHDFETRRAELAEGMRAKEAALHSEIERERKAILEAARKEAEGMISGAREHVERDRKQTVEDLKDQIAGLAVDLARTALGDGAALTGDDLFERVMGFLDQSPETRVEDLRADLGRSAKGVSVVTAQPLPEPERKRWRDAMTARFAGAKVAFETDPDILGGVELRFPHAVLSFSVADRLRRAADGMKAG